MQRSGDLSPASAQVRAAATNAIVAPRNDQETQNSDPPLSALDEVTGAMRAVVVASLSLVAGRPRPGETFVTDAVARV